MGLKMRNQHQTWDTDASNGRGETGDGNGSGFACDDEHGMHFDIEAQGGYAELLLNISVCTISTLIAAILAE